MLTKLIIENFQLAKKLYINTNKLDQDSVDFLKTLSNSDFTFKTLADLYIEDQDDNRQWKENDWKNVLTQLRNYNSKILPIKDFSYDSPSVTVSKELLKDREKILKILNTWPSIAKRNLKSDISIPRNSKEFKRLLNLIMYIDGHLHYLDNRTPEIKDAIYKKIFSSDHSSFHDVLDFCEDKLNLMHGSAYSRDELKKLVEENYDSLKIVYEKNDIVIVDVTSQSGIKVIGCNSLWCFTYGDEYGKAGEQWEHYSYNGHVYAIIDFSMPQDDPEFIHIITKPWYTNQIPYYNPHQKTFDFYHDVADDKYYGDNGIYNMANEPLYGNPYEILNGLVNHDPSALKVFTFRDL